MSSFEEQFKKDFEDHFSYDMDILIEKPLLVQMIVQKKYGASTWSPIHFMGFLPENEQYMMFAAKITDSNVIALKTGHLATMHLSLPYTSNWSFSGKLYNVAHPKTYTRFFPPNIFDEASKFFWHKKRLDLWLRCSTEFRSLLCQSQFVKTNEQVLDLFYKQLNDSSIELPSDEHADQLQKFCFLVLKVSDVTCTSQDTMTELKYYHNSEQWEMTMTEL